MKIILVKPRYFDRQHRSYFTICLPPMGLTYLASILIKKGFEVSILDMEALNMDEFGFLKYLKNKNPDVVGFDIRTPLVYKVAKLAEIVKRYRRDIKIIIGGPHLFVLPQNALEIVKNADFGLRGECEFTLLELIEGILLNKKINELINIEGICFRNENNNYFISSEIPLIEDLNSLPMPSHHLLPIQKYFDSFIKGKRHYSIITTRGCPYGCIFCGQSLLYGRRIRARSVTNVLEEVELLVKKYNIDSISFVDATFNYSRERIIAICREIFGRKLKFEWRVKARPDLVDHEMLFLMKKAGCKLISYGVESASDETLEYLKKDFTIKDVRRAFKLTKEVDIATVGYFLIGSPNESKEDCIKTIRFAKELDPLYVQFMFPLPLPGTELFKILQEKNLIKINWDNYYFHFLNYEHPCIKERELKKILAKAYFNFYFCFPYILKHLKDIKSLYYLLWKIKVGISAFLIFLRDTFSKSRIIKFISETIFLC